MFPSYYCNTQLKFQCQGSRSMQNYKIFIPTARSRTITLLRLHRNYKLDNINF